jgi:catalase
MPTRSAVAVSNNNIDGSMQSVARRGDVNYEPTSAANTPVEQPAYRSSQYPVSGQTQQKAIDKQDNFRQAGEFYRALDKHEQDDLVKNLAADLIQVKSIETRRAMVSHFYEADQEYGTRLAVAVGVDIKDVHAMIGH